MMLIEKRQVIAGRFEIADPGADRLGHGGIGTVYRGRDMLTARDVAIKVLRQGSLLSSAEVIDRFNRESEALRMLKHPNIVRMVTTVHETAQANGAEDAYYLVMEYASGGTLKDLLDRRRGRLPLKQALEIGLDLSDALARAHQIGVIHRDIKPSNVLLTADGAPLLTDFDLALLSNWPNLDQPGAVVGTLAYLSPEACNGESLNQLSDIWSFGVLLWEMVTGRQPFIAETIGATLAAILSSPLPDLRAECPEAPDRLAQLLAYMLEKNRRLRLSGMRLVGAELEAILAPLASGTNGSNNGKWRLGLRPVSLRQLRSNHSLRPAQQAP